MTQLIYKIVPRSVWDSALVTTSFPGAGIDLQDGYIHFSTGKQARETASKHFAGQTDLLLVAIDVDALDREMPGCLRWEPSRGGALFPHLYGVLSMGSVCWTSSLPWDPEKGHQFPIERGDFS